MKLRRKNLIVTPASFLSILFRFQIVHARSRHVSPPVFVQHSREMNNPETTIDANAISISCSLSYPKMKLQTNCRSHFISQQNTAESFGRATTAEQTKEQSQHLIP